MPIDYGIYRGLNIPDPMGLANTLDLYQNAKNEKIDRANKLAQLAQQQEMQGYKLNEARRSESSIPQQTADAQQERLDKSQEREANYMRGVSAEIANNPQNMDAILQKHAAQAPALGINPEHITWLAQDLSTSQSPEEMQTKAWMHSLTQKEQADYQTKLKLEQAKQTNDAPKTRTFKNGKNEITQELVNGKWNDIGTAPIWNPNVGQNENKPPAGYRFLQNGDLQKIPGGPADDKEIQKTSALETGRKNVTETIAALRDSYRQLQDNGGITDTSKGTLSNISSGTASSGIGQAFGRMVGTQNQSKRNEILMTRPTLLQNIMKATGMSAKQMDSNAELKLWLSTATDPTLDIQANLDALDRIEKTYGLGGGINTPTNNSKPQNNIGNGWGIERVN